MFLTIYETRKHGLMLYWGIYMGQGFRNQDSSSIGLVLRTESMGTW